MSKDGRNVGSVHDNSGTLFEKKFGQDRAYTRYGIGSSIKGKAMVSPLGESRHSNLSLGQTQYSHNFNRSMVNKLGLHASPGNVKRSMGAPQIEKVNNQSTYKSNNLV